jgi:hypothetical protein
VQLHVAAVHGRQQRPAPADQPAGGRVRPVAAAALCALLVVEAAWEERQMRARFPEYQAYARRTPRFVPWLGGSRAAR